MLIELCKLFRSRRDIISHYRKNPNQKYESLKKSFVTTLVATTLDHYYSDIDRLNYAIEALHSIEPTPRVNLYFAFLFRAIGSIELANSYLNEACNEARDKRVLEYCKGQEI
jgi:hypothetical protein